MTGVSRQFIPCGHPVAIVPASAAWERVELSTMPEVPGRAPNFEPFFDRRFLATYELIERQLAVGAGPQKVPALPFMRLMRDTRDEGVDDVLRVEHRTV